MPDVSFEYDPVHDRMFGKAFDCRVGCAALLETMKRLEKEPLSIHVTGVLSSQEEVGERGASVAVHTVQPQIAICFEGVFSYLTREFARRGANVLVVLSNDAWYPTSNTKRFHNSLLTTLTVLPLIM